MTRTTILALTLTACTPVASGGDHDRVITATDCDTVFLDPTSSTSSTEESSTTGPAFDCPTIADGDVSFCAPGYDCRTAYVVGAAQADATSTLLLYWHGTYEGSNNPLTNALPWGFQTAADNADALIVMPRAHAQAVGRAAPFPWFSVCAQVNPTLCDRTDDFALAEMIASCVVEQGLADPDRLTTAGMSAGGIMVSHLVAEGIGVHELAAAVPWSGGSSAGHTPTVPASDATSVFALHGGTSDVYCGAGNPAGTCNGYQPYSFVLPTEQLASDVDAAGNFAAVCDHGAGHSPAMGPQGVEFLLSARASVPHPWIGFPFGVEGNGSWPGMSPGTSWMLRNYGDCHNPL